MSKTTTTEAVVLHTHSIGDADRFCILLTEKRGKIPARARGVRKPGSKMGGTLLPLQRIRLTLREGSSGWHIQEATIVGQAVKPNLQNYIEMTKAMELLLALLPDDHAVPDVYALTEQFLSQAQKQSVSSMAFCTALLQMLGYLPRESDHQLYRKCTEAEKSFVHSIAEGQTPESTDGKHLQYLCDRIVEEHSDRTIRAGNMHIV